VGRGCLSDDLSLLPRPREIVASFCASNSSNMSHDPVDNVPGIALHVMRAWLDFWRTVRAWLLGDVST
jgi:hypothetical protein